jgi:hypothetical protein
MQRPRKELSWIAPRRTVGSACRCRESIHLQPVARGIRQRWKAFGELVQLTRLASLSGRGPGREGSGVCVCVFCPTFEPSRMYVDAMGGRRGVGSKAMVTVRCAGSCSHALGAVAHLATLSRQAMSTPWWSYYQWGHWWGTQL